MASLLVDCQKCFEKGHESWNSYFSKWEVLAKHEEEIPENDLHEDWCEDIKQVKAKQVNKKKKPPLQRKPTTFSLLTTKQKYKNRKNSRKLTKKRKIPMKNEQSLQAIIEQSESEDRENSPEEMDSELLEMNLRTVLMNILKTNQNKWEIFGVLSQTFSQSESAVKDSVLPFQNQRPTLTSKDFKLNRRSFSFQCERFSPLPTPKINFPVDSQIFSDRNFDRFGICTKPDTFNSFNFNYTRQQLMLPSSSIITPPQTLKIDVESRFLRSCPASFSYPYYRRFELETKTLQFGGYPALEYNKKINQEFIRNHDETPKRRVLEVSNSWEGKSSPNLCSRKRTNIYLNMENSNFITPKSKPSKRKCFSENVLQRKRSKTSKLFFDTDDEDSENDDRSVKQSPLIRWNEEKQKSVLTPQVNLVESDSDESESIFDRVKKP